MTKLIGIVVAVVVVVILAALIVPINPEEQRPGTRLSGTWTTQQSPDWSTIRERQKVHLQTATWYQIPHSVTTVSFVRDGVLYIPCGNCANKRWPKNVARDSHVVVRVNDTLYPLTMSKIVDPADKRLIVYGNKPVPSEQAGRNFDLYRLDPQ